MLQLQNESPFQPQLAVFPDERGIDCAYVTVKGTFTLGRRPAPAEKQEPVLLKDEYWDDPATSGLRWAGEVHLTKPGTDVVLNGHARAPGGKAVTRLDVTLRVGDRSKAIRVHGDRVWKPGMMGMNGISSPEPFREMPLVYERAFGGIHEVGDKDGTVLFEPRNPVGRGFVGRRTGKELKDYALPNLEDPADEIDNVRAAPAPACFGFVAPSWQPRRGFAGTYDEAWTKQRAPYLPEDFDPRFFHAAHPDLALERYLIGGERIEVTNVAESGSLQFEIPKPDLAVSVRLRGADERPPLNLETVLIEPDESRLTLVWRAAVPCDKSALRVESVTVAMGSPVGAGARR
jgi:hypothetical protein